MGDVPNYSADRHQVWPRFYCYAAAPTDCGLYRQIFDARTAAEFRGEDLKGNSRGGHLPGAAHVSHDELLDGTHLRPAAEIAQLLDAERIDGSKPIVSHCNGGGRAALAALAAVVAGRDSVHVYYLSFADWAADESCPVRRPD